MDGVADAGRADLYETLAKPLPLLMITRLLGIERDDQFWEWVELLMYGRVEGIDAATVLATAQALYDFLADQLDQRRAAPGDDLLSLLLRGRRQRPPVLARRDPRPGLLPRDRRHREHGVLDPRDAASSRRSSRRPRGARGGSER